MSLNGWQIAGEGLEGGAPHPGNHVDDKGEHRYRQCQPCHRDELQRRIILELELAQEVESQQAEHHDPDGKIDLPVKKTPVVSLVGHAEELESQGDLDESKHDLDTVEP